MTQPISGAIPPELLMLTLRNTGADKLLKTGGVVPWKFTVPELSKPALRASVCVPIPEKMVVPELPKLPELKKSPLNVQVEPPAVYVPERFIVPFTVRSLSP